MILFNGTAAAAALEHELQKQVTSLATQVKIVSFFFAEDAGSALYTRLKREAAERVGILYQPVQCSFAQPVQEIVAQVVACGRDGSITGVLIQKPTKKTWEAAMPPDKRVGEAGDFATWWSTLTQALPAGKDVDGLSPSTLSAIASGTWQQEHRVLPATCRAVVSIVMRVKAEYPEKKLDSVSIVGVSDLLGTPLAGVLTQLGFAVQLLRKAEFMELTAHGTQPLTSDVIVSATGVPGRITGECILPGAVLVDVGEPKPDVDRTSVQDKAFFLTPVPGGVGPLTVLCLLMNAVDLCRA